MDRDLYQCTAGDLATKSVDTIPAEWSVEQGREWLSENGYDVSPVVEGEQPVGFVAIEDLSDVPDSASISEHHNPITLEEIISTDADFGSSLSALYDVGFYFLGGRNQVTGVLTRADLNTSPAYIHLYDRLSLLEESFRDLITAEAPDWKDNSEIDLYRDEIRDIERRYQQAESANIALEAIHYAQFSTLAKIITAVKPCWRACGFSNGDVAERDLSDVTDVRNAVAHSNLLIENTGQGLMEGRTVATVLDAYETIEACIEALDTGST
jgi:hypothetical protein